MRWRTISLTIGSPGCSASRLEASSWPAPVAYGFGAGFRLTLGPRNRSRILASWGGADCQPGAAVASEQRARSIETAPLLTAFRARHPKTSTALISRAYERSAQAHAGQMRKTGESYIHHPLSVARIVAGLGLDDITVAAALLHDAVEDTGVTLDDIETEFGSRSLASSTGSPSSTGSSSARRRSSRRRRCARCWSPWPRTSGF